MKKGNLRRWDVRSDGKIFWGYDVDGYELWMTKERISQRFPNAKPRERNELTRFFNKVEKTDGCWLWKGSLLKTGYGSFGVKGKTMLAHHYLLPRKLLPHECACHKCDVRKCVNPDHIHIGDRKWNMNDAAEKGKIHRKLTDAQAEAIRMEYAFGNIGQIPLSKKYGVTRNVIHLIVKNKSYIAKRKAEIMKHLTEVTI